MTATTLKPVGNIKPEEATRNEPGYEAQGFALAQMMKATIVNHARDLRRMLTTAWAMDSKAREFCVRDLKAWQKQCKENAESTRPHDGFDPKEWARIANSATTRVSEFTTVLRAMSAGMTVSTAASMLGVQQDDMGNVSFHVLVKLARDYNNAQAKTAPRGRQPDPFAVALAKWLDKHEPDTDTELEIFNKIKAEVMKALPKEQ